MEKAQINRLVQSFQQELDRVASIKTKSWWENYLKQVIPFRGVGIPVIRELLSDWREKNQLEQLGKDQELEIALSFFEESYSEDKLTAILYLQDYLLHQFDGKTLFPYFEQLYHRELIFDWNVCDWFCVRVLGPGILAQGKSWAETLAAWKDAPYLWQARSSLVPFVKVVRDRSYYPLIRIISETLIQREERFAKTAVGWILRDISKYDKTTVIDFLEYQLNFFTIETVRNATQNLGPQVQKNWVEKLKSMSK